jgi:hypothetical protein
MENTVLWVPFKGGEQRVEEMFERMMGGKDEDDEEEGPVYQDQFDDEGHGKTQLIMHGGNMGDISAIGRFKYMPWIFLTNFDVDQRKLAKLKKLPGVEIIEQMTRYQFFVGVGVLFCKHEVNAELDDVSAWDSSDIRRKIEKFLLDDEKLLDKVPSDVVQSNKSRLEKKFKHWAFLVFPNGKIAEAGSDDLSNEDFLRKVNVFYDTAEGTTAQCFDNVSLS